MDTIAGYLKCIADDDANEKKAKSKKKAEYELLVQLKDISYAFKWCAMKWYVVEFHIKYIN